MSETAPMTGRPLISGSFYLVTGPDDPGSSSVYRVAVDSEERDVVQVTMSPTADPEETGEMAGLLRLNLHNAKALRDELDRHLAYWEPSQ